MALYNDRHPDGSVTANFNSTRADTGRFTAKSSKDLPKMGAPLSLSTEHQRNTRKTHT